MTGTIELTPDQLANLVALVFKANGFEAFGLELLDQGNQRVGYSRVVVHYEAAENIKVFPPPSITRDDLNKMLNPYDRLPTFSNRQPVGAEVG